MKCIVGIPTHKADWNIFERISLEQCDRILAEYDKAFIIPMGLELNCKNQYQEYKIERFPDIYFSNSRMYNELCLTEEFYKRFIDYDYMLIYQLDSFVFYDGLKKFCEKGFDYIGAPVITGVWETLNMNVGNGGLSLRNVKRVLGLLEEQKYLLNHSAMSGLFYSAEDTFFSYCGSRGEIDFRVPDIRLASEFSIEIDCVGLDASRREKLPFGTHGWERRNYVIWKPIIESYGYHLLPIENVKYVDTDALTKDWLSYCSLSEMADKLKKNSLFFESCSVWGAGAYGKRCIRLLEKLKIKIKYVFDWNKNALEFAEDLNYSIYPPTIKNLMSNTEILIISIKDREDKEIANKIKMLRPNSYLFYDELFQMCLMSGINNL